MPQFSMTQQGLLLFVVTSFVRLFGIDLDDGQITEAVAWIATGIAAVTIYVGRYRQGDITWYGRKIK